MAMKFEAAERQEHEAAGERGARGVEAMRQRKREVQKPGSRAGKGYFDHKGRWQYGERPGKERTTRAAEKQLGLGRMKPAAEEDKDKDIREGVRGAMRDWDAATPEQQKEAGEKASAAAGKAERKIGQHRDAGNRLRTANAALKPYDAAKDTAREHDPEESDREIDDDIRREKSYFSSGFGKVLDERAKAPGPGGKGKRFMQKGLVNEGKPPADSMKSAPPGWGGTVEHMKEHKDISNPFALAWHMKKKGMKPHYAETRKAGIPGCSTCLKAAFDAGMMKGGKTLVDGLYYQIAGGKILYLP